MNQSQFLAIICNSLEAHVPGAIGFGFASHWLQKKKLLCEELLKLFLITFSFRPCHLQLLHTLLLQLTASQPQLVEC